MIKNRTYKKWILVLTGLVFIAYPAFDYYIAMNKDPMIIMYVIAVLIGLGYFIYGLVYK
jgi:hypothetical protein